MSKVVYVCDVKQTLHFMKTKWLFPHRFRLIGWLVFIPLAILGMVSMNGEFEFSLLTLPIVADDFLGSPILVNLTNELAAVGVIVGLLFIAFSREKVEDEMISQLRLEALQWSVYVNYLILIILIIAVHGGNFLLVTVYNMFTVLLVFIARFRWLIFGTTIIYARYEKPTES